LLFGPACASRTAGPAIPPAPPSLSRQIDAILASVPVDRAMWGILIRRAGGEILYQRDETRLLHPASNMKILTLAAAAERLGWEFTFETTVRVNGPLDHGTVRGDVIVAGSGDPTISRRHDGGKTLAGWADLLWQQGVRRVQGRVIGDGTRFGGTTLGQGWQWDDLPFGYSAPVSALSYNENTAEFLVAPGASPGALATVTLLDTAASVQVRNGIRTVSGDSARRISISQLPGNAAVTVTGEVPIGLEPFKLTVAVPDPPLYFARAFRAALVARGITVTGAARSAATDPAGPVAPGAAILVRHTSPPLRTMAATLMKVSQNLYAELLLHALGAADGKRGTDALADTLAGWGAGTGTVAVGDGSGLTRYNLVSAATVDLVLSKMFAAPIHREPWLAAMPVAGQDGTLLRRMKGTAAEGRVFAKTGSIAYVRALSGHARALDDAWIQFTVLANNFAGPGAVAEIDRATDQIVTLLVTMPEAQRR
jgi:D-alanyl-D-alanine carboxypeptidase/D-alanyl-D-alanine-endopeptidase (penicillin-binding protein 4)